MGDAAIIVIAAWAAGSTAVVGGLIAWGVGGRGAEAKREITHGVVAFGGGILIAAVAFALLPQGMAVLSPAILAGAFCFGGCLFGVRPDVVILSLLAVSLFGPVLACTGYFFLQEEVKLTAGIMAFAGGGIMYLIFQDIAPQAKMRRHWIPALGTVLGFAVGMTGKQLIG